MRDRRDDLTVSAGENVYPAEVEAALVAHPAVMSAAVVGLPDERWSQVVSAAIVQTAEVTDGELEACVRAQLAGYKVPRRFVRVDERTRTSNGKIQRRLVRNLSD